MRPALERAAAGIDAVNTAVGRLAAWLYPVLVLLVLLHVLLRYLFGLNLIELEELHWHVYAAAFLLCYGYTYAKNEHVRVDLVSSAWQPRTRAWVEVAGVLVLLLPFTLILSWYAIDFFWQSFVLRERSEMPGGLPGRYILKFILLVSLLLLTLQGLAVAARAVLEKR